MSRIRPQALRVNRGSPHAQGLVAALVPMGGAYGDVPEPVWDPVNNTWHHFGENWATVNYDQGPFGGYVYTSDRDECYGTVKAAGEVFFFQALVKSSSSDNLQPIVGDDLDDNIIVVPQSGIIEWHRTGGRIYYSASDIYPTDEWVIVQGSFVDDQTGVDGHKLWINGEPVSLTADAGDIYPQGTACTLRVGDYRTNVSWAGAFKWADVEPDWPALVEDPWAPFRFPKPLLVKQGLPGTFTSAYSGTIADQYAITTAPGSGSLGDKYTIYGSDYNYIADRYTITVLASQSVPDLYSINISSSSTLGDSYKISSAGSATIKDIYTVSPPTSPQGAPNADFMVWVGRPIAPDVWAGRISISTEPSAVGGESSSLVDQYSIYTLSESSIGEFYTIAAPQDGAVVGDKYTLGGLFNSTIADLYSIASQPVVDTSTIAWIGRPEYKNAWFGRNYLGAEPPPPPPSAFVVDYYGIYGAHASTVGDIYQIAPAIQYSGSTVDQYQIVTGTYDESVVGDQYGPYSESTIGDQFGISTGLFAAAVGDQYGLYTSGAAYVEDSYLLFEAGSGWIADVYNITGLAYTTLREQYIVETLPSRVLIGDRYSFVRLYEASIGDTYDAGIGDFSVIGCRYFINPFGKKTKLKPILETARTKRTYSTIPRPSNIRFAPRS